VYSKKFEIQDRVNHRKVFRDSGLDDLIAEQQSIWDLQRRGKNEKEKGIFKEENKAREEKWKN
jgi:hypothetical protein